ncbi:MAG: hypothetical protein ACTTJI_00420 [Capnocytophaga sp.]|uniref:hypothetical protein n=1 Tax=Capnocytophaga sp. TaxID=44737 RepID=UPI003FA08F2A
MKYLSSILLFLAVIPLAMAQSPNILSPEYQNSQSNPWTYGGNIGLNYSNYGLGLDFSPRLGYKITENLELAAVVNGSIHHTQYFRNLSASIGPSLSYYFGRVAYLNTSYQHYFISQKSKSTSQVYKTEEDALYIGGGYMQNLGGNVYMQIGASYNILWKQNKSIFNSGFIPNVGIIIGI